MASPSKPHLVPPKLKLENPKPVGSNRGVKAGTKRGPYKGASQSQLSTITIPKANGATVTYAPDDKDRGYVTAMVLMGLPNELIAQIVGCSPETLVKHFRRELELAKAEMNAKVVQMLYNQAVVKENVVAAMFIAKTQLGWRENPPPAPPPPPRLDYDLSKLPTQKLQQLRLLLAEAMIPEAIEAPQS
jgi:AraC-like DNA-binding protein